MVQSLEPRNRRNDNIKEKLLTGLEETRPDVTTARYLVLGTKLRCAKIGLSRGLNGVAMDRHGLILWENEATGSRKVFRYLLDLRDAIF